MKSADFLIASGLPREETLAQAATMAKRNHCPVGVEKLASGSTLLFVLDTQEMKDGEFQQIVCPDETPQIYVVKSADDCPAFSPD